MFSEHFSFHPHALLNFVGGGGKTKLILKLMEEYCADGPVLYTTTTRIHPPDPKENLLVVSTDNISLLKSMVESVGRSWGNRPVKIAATRHYISPTLMRGVPADFCSQLNRGLFPVLLNEADGAAGFSVKMPREHEPVLMEKADYLVPVIGIDCLNRPLGPDVVFRWKDFAPHSSLREGDPITPDIAAGLLMHEQGVCRYWKPGTPIIAFINKVDYAAQDGAARELAHLILCNDRFPVERVVYGSVQQDRSYSIVAPQTHDHCTADKQE